MPAPQYRGSPIPLLTAAPEWSRGVAAGFEMETVVLESLTTRENRISRSGRVLRSLRYESVSHGSRESARLRRWVAALAAAPVLAPWWPDARALTAPAGPGSATIAHEDAAGTELLAEDTRWLALLDMDAGAAEVLEIASAGETETVLAEAPAAEWPEGSAVLAVFPGWLRRPESRQWTDEAGRLRVDWEERVLDGVRPRPSVVLDLGDGGTRLDLGDGETVWRLN